MLFKEFLQEISKFKFNCHYLGDIHSIDSYKEKDICGFFFDSRKVLPQSAFFALPKAFGHAYSADAHKEMCGFIQQALQKGAVVFVLPQDLVSSKISDATVADGQGDVLSLALCDILGITEHHAMPDVAIIIVDNTREVLGALASSFYSHPSHELFTVGVTGTNGKTTVTLMLEWMMNQLGFPCAVMGTIDHHLGNKSWKTNMTTPDPLQFNSRLREFVELGAKALAAEVSSHALHQYRADGVQWDTAIFTNLSRDHLDYHESMQAYFQAKARLFLELLWKSNKKLRRAVINRDDVMGVQLIEEISRLSGEMRNNCEVDSNVSTIEIWSFGLGLNEGKDVEAQYSSGFLSQIKKLAEEIGRDININDLVMLPLSQNLSGAEINCCLRSLSFPHAPDFDKVNQKTLFQGQLKLPLVGEHNLYNVAAAIAVGCGANWEWPQVLRSFESFPGVPGRLQAVPNSHGLHVFIDFAHTDAALDNILLSLKTLKEKSLSRGTIRTLFGCGGDRDKGKRPLMLKAALKHSDYVYLTSDNPRHENPQQIIDDALKGLDDGCSRQTEVYTEVDRLKAIHHVLSVAQTGDIVLIAGKGHESTQQIGDEFFPFSDYQAVADFFLSKER